MEESGLSMRSSPQSRNLGEMTIKVPAPFAGISDLGFTAQYRAQHFNEPQRDVPLLFEGPAPPVERLAEVLQLLSGSRSRSYAWTDPVLLGDGVVILAYRDRRWALVSKVKRQRDHDHAGDDGQHESDRPPLPTQHSPVHESSILTTTKSRRR